MLKIQNTLTKVKEEFTPIFAGKVNMYACGVTVYDHCHIGHGRSIYVFEVIRRYLGYKGYDVKFVRNITDVDDKIINKARVWAVEKKISLQAAFDEVRLTYIKSYEDDLQRLKIPKADYEPRATENINDMIEYIAQLIANGFAYESGGSVYFSVRKAERYGQLSGKKIDDLLQSVRIDCDRSKNDPLDFALWKNAKDDEPSWDSPWGKGRPGWHIECSVMSQKCLQTETLDVHGGGRDLVFPHHENEIAQSEAFTGKQFARYWVHHGLLTIDKQKMAKSSGNFVTVRDVLAKYPADILKIFYAQSHYSSSIDFSWAKMDEAKKMYERINILWEKINGKNLEAQQEIANTEYAEIKAIRDKFIAAMDDDFNTPKGLAAIFELVTLSNKNINDDGLIFNAKNLLVELCSVLNLGLNITVRPETLGLTIEAHSPQVIITEPSQIITKEEIEERIAQRLECKKQKKFQEADKIRQELDAMGIILEDTKDGTTWRKKI